MLRDIAKESSDETKASFDRRTYGGGKTALSIELAKRYQGEVISGDSMQVYRTLDIGTAKVMPDEMQGIKHHLIDILIRPSVFHAPILFYDAKKAAKKFQNEKASAACGRYRFYVQALLDGFKLGKDEYSADEKERAKWHDYAENHGRQALWNKLNEVDPIAAAKIPVGNEVRVVRALEVYEKTGKKFSEQNDVQDGEFDALIIGLTTDRTLLYERINQRVDLMMKRGLEKEARSLYEAGGSLLPAGKGIGYKEFYPYFAGESTLEESVDLVKKNSRHYAKRQLTWFRNKMDVVWFDLVQHPEQIKNICAVVDDWLLNKER